MAEAVLTTPKRQKSLKYPQNHFPGTGRRKTSVARVLLYKGTGVFQVNERELDAYFVRENDRQAVLEPLRAARGLGKYDVYVNVSGGGISGQAGAVRLGIARALVRADGDAEAALRGEGHLTRDAREVERKKYGQRGARRRFQFSKR